MEIKARDLRVQLKKELKPVYLLSGDDPLQLIEAVDLIREQARTAGFTERVVYHADRSFNWNLLLEAGGNLSLFGDKQLIELRMPTGKPGTTGTKVLREYAQGLSDETLLIIQSAKLDRAQMKSKWVQALDQAGAHIRVWPLYGDELVRWISERMEARGLPVDKQYVYALASRSEGNLLAAQQEIEKLSLLAGSMESSSPKELFGALDQSQFNVFDLVDTILARKQERALQIINKLNADGVAPTLVLWGLVELVRAMLVVKQAQIDGGRDAVRIQNTFLYSKRKPIEYMVREKPIGILKHLLKACAYLDRVIKGRAVGDLWQDFAEISTLLCAEGPLAKNRYVFMKNYSRSEVV